LSDRTPVAVLDPDGSIGVNAPECFGIGSHPSSVHRSFTVSIVELPVGTERSS
jgi:hypothetical protein